METINTHPTLECVIDLCHKHPDNFARMFKLRHRDFWENNISTMSGKNISEKIYRYFYPNSGTCQICKSGKCKYRSFVVGYWPTCGYKCSLVNESREKYGVDNRFQSEIIKAKSKKTLEHNYRIEHPCEIHLRWKEYKMPSGKIVKYQGYENMAIDYLLNSGVSEENILIEKKLQPKIFYLYNGKSSRYYMDLYIKNVNKIIEVKSEWTYKIHKDRNEEKKAEAIRQGYDFEFWIFNNKRELTIL